MDLNFDKGDSRNPRGHALAYFQTSSEPGKIYATYIVVLPITMDLAKYVPPFLASHLGTAQIKDMSAFALPPVPEEVDSYEQLCDLAEARDDDLIQVPMLSSFDIPEMMQLSSDVVQQYSQLWTDYLLAKTPPSTTHPESLGVSAVIYSLMNGKDKVGELAKLISKLSFGTQGNDQQMISEVKEEIRLLGGYLPDEYQIDNLIQATEDSSASSPELARLYLERCYKLSDGDSDGVLYLERQIKSLKT